MSDKHTSIINILFNKNTDLEQKVSLIDERENVIESEFQYKVREQTELIQFTSDSFTCKIESAVSNI